MSVYSDERLPSATFGILSLRRRWKLIGGCVLFSLLLGLSFLALRPASYTASTQLLIYVKEVQPGPDLVISLGRADLTQVENESEVIRARGTLMKVVRALDLADDPEFVPAATPLRGLVQWLLGTSLAASDESRNRQEIAVAALARHVAVKRVGTSHTVLVNVTTSVPEKSALIANSISQVMLRARLSGEQDGDRSPLLRERLQGLGPSAYVMTPALVPEKPNGPRKILVILAALIAGFVAGSALSLLLDFLNRTIRTAVQVERLGLECIGAIPACKREARATSGLSQPGEAWSGSDAFSRNPLLQQTLGRVTVAIEEAKARTVGVASAVAGEGATTVARHLAQMAARSQRKVLLVEADRGEPLPMDKKRKSFGHLIEAETRPLSPGERLGIDHAGGLDVLARAALGADSGAVTWRMQCDEASLAAYDLIVVSLPPLEEGAEFRTAAQDLDGILLVMKWGAVETERVERAFAVSGAAPSEFIGAVLNMVDDRMIGRFGDKLWQAEAIMAARRRLFGSEMPTEPVTGSA